MDFITWERESARAEPLLLLLVLGPPSFDQAHMCVVGSGSVGVAPTNNLDPGALEQGLEVPAEQASAPWRSPPPPTATYGQE